LKYNEYQYLESKGFYFLISHIAQRYEPKKTAETYRLSALEENEHELDIVSHIAPSFKDKGAGDLFASYIARRYVTLKKS